MFRKKKLANTRARREKEMAVDSIPVIDLLNQSNFVDELYSKVLDSIVNRLQSQVKEVAEKDLLLYLQQLFRVSAEKHQDYLNRARRNGLSQQCVVRAHVQKAEKLAAKDSNGLSDPYCMVSVVPSSQFVNLQSAKLNVVKSTSVKESSLNPEWNESYDLFVPRDQIDDFHVQLQVWDYDGNTSGSSKKLHGMKRYVKEVAQAVTSKDDDADDFMGFISVPLSKIPTEGLDSWFKLRPAHSLQRISGRIRFRLELNPLCQQSSDVFNYPDDVILAGLLTAAVENAYQQYDVKKDENKSSDWNGKLPQAAETIIHGFVEQRLVKLLTRAIVRWEVYIGVHLQAGRSLDALFVDGLLKLLEMSSSCVDEQDSSSGSLGSGRYTHVAVIRDSLFKFVKMEIEKIRNHRELFTPQQNNYVVNLGNLLLGLKKIRGMSLYKYLHKHAPSPPTSPDIRDDVIAMLVEGTEAYYAALYDKLLEDSLEEHTSPDVNDNDPPFGGQTVSVLIRLAEQLYRDLSFGLTIYHGVFSKVFDLDYHSYVFQVVEKNLARDASDAMYKVNKTLSLIDDPNHVESETKSILLFRLYLTMRDLSSLAKCVKRIDLSTITTSLSRTSIESDTGVSSDNGQVVEDGCSATVEASDITRYHDWFRPTVIRWLQMSRGRTHDRLRKAVALDKTKAVDEIVKHTSSAVDTIGCLTGHVVAFWKSLSWPDPVDAYTIALRMTDDVANAIERYADLVQHKLKEVGFFDDEGQFDVTEELCLTLNNLQYVKSFIEGLPEKMDFRGIAHAVEAHPEGPAGDRVLTTFQALTSVANIGMEKKIKCITAMVGTKMKPDIRKYLRTFAQQAVKCGLGADFHKDQNQNERRKLAETANVAIRPLMNYLHNNITTLNEWLCEPNFKRVLEVLWKVCLQVFRKLTLSEYSQYRPFFFFQSSHALKHHLADFFHADGSGISQQRMNSNEDFRILQSELRMRSAKTQDLMRLFYMQMYEEQQEMASKPLYGFLNIHAWYDLLGEEVNVDIISANELKPLDVNGLSDPFVKVKLGPVMMFLEHREKQTLVEKKTLDPLYDNESFAFQVGKDRVSLDGAMLVFTVLDHDVIGSNDLEGEAVLPLNMLDGVIEDSKANSRNFRLPLTQPGPWCTQARKKKTRGRDANTSSVGEEAKNVAGTSSFSNVSLNEDGLEFQSSFSISPLVLINARSSFDKDAAEFSRGRKRLQSIAETD